MTAPATARAELDQALELDPQVALRDEDFGALAYHYGTRRLVFLKSRRLVDIVRSLGEHESGLSAVAALTEPAEQDRYAAALEQLLGSGVVVAR